MGFISMALGGGNRKVTAIPAGVMAGSGGGVDSGGFERFAKRGYRGNEIVFAAIELLCTSATEPKIIGKRGGKSSGKRIQRSMQLAGVPKRLITAYLVENGFVEELTDHPLVMLLNNPNPYKNRFLFWSTYIMDRYLAGNAYLLKVRGGLGNTAELWRLRPDRVRIIPDKDDFCKYEYTVDRETVTFERKDIIHWKTRNPLDDYYGQPPLMAISGRIDIDNYMREFLQVFFERGGTGPGAILTIKGELDHEDKEGIQDRLRRMFGGRRGWFETLVLDNSEGSTYTQMGLDRGLRDALPVELNSMSEARISMAFGIPGSILGLLIGYESSSYANRRSDWQVLWDITLTPLYEDLDAELNLTLTPEFGGIDEVCHDLSQVRALQEDEDKIQERARANFASGLWAREEARPLTGVSAEPPEGSMFFIPANIVPTPVERIGEEIEAPDAPEPAPKGPGSPPGVDTTQNGPLAGWSQAVREGRRGRPALIHDAEARALWRRAEELRKQYPRMTTAQIASRVGIAESTLRKYRAVFAEPLAS